MKICENGVIRELTQEEIIKMQFEQEEAEKQHFQSMSYGELVNLFIRERYSLSEELAILRQKDEKPEEYKAYYAYCEECKEKAKALRGDIK